MIAPTLEKICYSNRLCEIRRGESCIRLLKRAITMIAPTLEGKMLVEFMKITPFMLVLCVISSATHADVPSLLISDCEDIGVWNGGQLSKDHVKQGGFAIEWAHGESSSISISQFPHDWSDYNQLSFWLYSQKATGSRFMLILPSENDKMEGMDYYSLRINLNFTGWRRFAIPLAEMGINRSPLGWHEIQSLSFTASGWGNEPHPEAVVYVDDLVLSREAIMKGPRIADEEFIDALNMDYPGMEKVKAAAEKGDLRAAKHEYVEHIKRREKPVWHFNWRDKPDVKIPQGGSEGWDYFSKIITVDWEGEWKRFRLEKADFDTAREPIGWNWITYITFSATGWDLTPDSDTTLYIDDVKLVGKKSTAIGDFQSEDTGWDGLKRTSERARSGKYSGKWENMQLNTRVRAWNIEHDWTEYEAIEFWMYSESATGAKVILVLDSDRPNTDSADKILTRELSSVGVPHKFEDEIDWTLNPINYREWPWQLNRHPFWVTLGRTYWSTGDEKYAKEFVYQMTHWVENCPVPTTNSGNSSATWRTIEAGIRTSGSWMHSFHYFLPSPSFTDDAVITMLKSFVEHARHLMTWPTGGNWLTMESNGLFHIGVMFPEFKEADNWRKTSVDRMYAELETQIYPDGAQIELTTGYHQVSLRNFVGLLKLAAMNDLEMPADYLSKLEGMYSYNLYASMPNGRLPGLNDGGMVAIRRSMREGFGYFPHRQDFQWAATGGAGGEKPAETSHAFPYAGQFAMRSGWEPDDRYLLMDAGPFGYGHQHEDKLSLVVYAYGKVHVIDPGNYAYDSSQWRRYIISTYAHNTILVDKMPQNRRRLPRSTFVVKEPLPNTWISRDDYDYCVSVYDEGYGREGDETVSHKRRVFFVKPDYWIVTDTLTPSDGAEHTYESMFHLDADNAIADEKTNKVQTDNADASNLAIIPPLGDDLTVEIISGQEEPVVQGWIPAGGYEVRPIPTPIFTKTGEGTTWFVYVFYPTPEGKELPVTSVKPLEIKSEGKIYPDARAVEISFSDGRTHYFLQADRSGKTLKFSGFSTSAEAALIQVGRDGNIEAKIEANK